MHNKHRNKEYIEDIQMIQPVKRKKKKKTKKKREDYLLRFTGCCL